MKKRRSITWRVAAYLLAFVFVLLTLFWASHKFLLTGLYRYRRLETVTDSVTELGEKLDSPQFFRTLSEMAREQSASIRVLRENGTEIYSLNYMPYSDLVNYSKDELFKLWNKVGSKDHYTEIYAMDSVRLKRLVPSGVDAIMYVQVFTESGRTTAIFYNSTITPIDGMVEVLEDELWWVMAISVLLTALLTYGVSRQVARPITEINAQARRMKNQDYSVVFDADDYLEVAELSETLNATSREMAKLDALRRDLLASVSHDLRTPLSMIIALSEVMRDVPGENTPENTQIIIDESNRLSELVSNVLGLPSPARGPDGLEPELYDLAVSCRATVARYRKFGTKNRYRIGYEGPDHLQVKADRLKLSQVIDNLINNAISHAGENPEVCLRIKAGSGCVRVEVSDRGEGIPEDKLRLIWEEFYTDTDDERFHAGLGLTIVRRILELHRARYGVDSAPGMGSTFWFELDVFETENGRS